MRRLEFKTSVSSNVSKYAIEWFVNGVSKTKTEVLSTQIMYGYYTGEISTLNEKSGDVVKAVVKAVSAEGVESVPASVEMTVPVVAPEPPTLLKIT